MDIFSQTFYNISALSFVSGLLLRIHIENLYTHTHAHIYDISFIHSSIVGHFGCFCVLAIVNNSAMNMRCMYLFESVFLFPLETKVELLGHLTALF